MKLKDSKLLLCILAASSIGLSSCYKKFDPKSYQPALNIGGYSSAAEVGASNLVGYWAFDGSLVDSVSNTMGTNSGAGFTNGIKGQAFQGGKGSYALFNPGDAIKNMQSFTISMWMNSPQNKDGIAGLIDLANANSFWGNLTVFLENGATADKGVLKIHVNNNGSDAWLGNYDLQNVWNVWTNIAVSYDAPSSTFKVYVNGAKIDTKVMAGFGPLHFVDPTQMVFGTVQFQTDPSLTSTHGKESWASDFTGAMDEVRLYNAALSESDVTSLVKLEGRGK